MSERLTVVFEYPDEASLAEAKAAFKKGDLPNLVHVESYDAVEAYRRQLKATRALTKQAAS